MSHKPNSRWCDKLHPIKPDHSLGIPLTKHHCVVVRRKRRQ